MKKIPSNDLIYYDIEIIKKMIEKYNMSDMDSFKTFVHSKTYKMLENQELEMYEYGVPAIFDMWESERVTGTPQNSVYLRSED